MSAPRPDEESGGADEAPTTLSTLAFALAAVSVLGFRFLIAVSAACAVLGVVLGAVALSRIRRGVARGRKRAVGAVILGGLGVAGVVFMLASFGA